MVSLGMNSYSMVAVYIGVDAMCEAGTKGCLLLLPPIPLTNAA